jgi:hypothetical protein
MIPENFINIINCLNFKMAKYFLKNSFKISENWLKLLKIPNNLQNISIQHQSPGFFVLIKNFEI